MKRLFMTWNRLLWSAIALITISSWSFAGECPTDIKAVTAADPKIPIEVLSHRVKPLTQCELDTEAQAWLLLLKDKVTGITQRRVDLVFGVGYSDDIDKTQSILEQIVNGHALVLKEPAAVVKLHELADSSVNLICRPWVKPEHYWDVYWDITREVKRRFDAEGVSIPFPQRDIHIYQET